MSFSIVLPLSKFYAPKSYEQFIKLGLPSYIFYLNIEDVDAIYIICTLKDRHDMEEEIYRKCLNKKWKGINKIVYIDEESLLLLDEITSFDSHINWYKQQILKIAISDLVKTDYYITLDGDLFLIDYLCYEDLFINGKIKFSSENSDQLHNCLKLLQYDIIDSTAMITPQIFITGKVVELVKYLKCLYSVNWQFLFITFKATIYIYWLYLLKNNLTDLYTDATTTDDNKCLIKKNSITFKNNIEQNIQNAILKKKTFFVNIPTSLNIDISFNLISMVSNYDLLRNPLRLKLSSIVDNIFKKTLVVENGSFINRYICLDINNTINTIYKFEILMERDNVNISNNGILRIYIKDLDNFIDNWTRYSSFKQVVILLDYSLDNVANKKLYKNFQFLYKYYTIVNLLADQISLVLKSFIKNEWYTTPFKSIKNLVVLSNPKAIPSIRYNIPFAYIILTRDCDNMNELDYDFYYPTNSLLKVIEWVEKNLSVAQYEKLFKIDNILDDDKFNLADYKPGKFTCKIKDGQKICPKIFSFDRENFDFMKSMLFVCSFTNNMNTTFEKCIYDILKYTSFINPLEEKLLTDALEH